MKKTISIILCLILTAMLFTGCSKFDKESAISVVTSMLDDLKSANYENVGQYIYPDWDVSLALPDKKNDNEELFNTVYSKMTYEVLEAKKVGDEKYVEVKITLPDVTDALSQYMLNLIKNSITDGDSDTNIKDERTKLIENLKNAEMKTETVKIMVDNIGSNYYIKPTSELNNLINGNMKDVSKNVEELVKSDN